MNETEENKLTFRNSHQRRSIKIGALKNFAKFTGKYLCQNPFFNEVVGLRLKVAFDKLTKANSKTGFSTHFQL